MFNLPIRNMYLANNLVDMRKSFNTLADYVRFYLGKDPQTGDAFIFIGKLRNRLKVLVWEESGYWLCCKKLEQGTFSKKLLPSGREQSVRISSSQWHNLPEAKPPESGRPSVIPSWKVADFKLWIQGRISRL